MDNQKADGEEEPPVLVDRHDHKLYITLNRPRALNAQNDPLRILVANAVAELDADPDLRVGIMTGAGGRAFSAGADLKEVTAPAEADTAGGYSNGPRPTPEQQRSNWIHFEAVRWAAKPLIAAIDGYCVGGGLELANYCDIRIATEASTFGQPEPRTIGATGGPALHQLSRLIPLGEAMLIHLTAQPISARRAYEIGLIQRLCPDRDALMQEADAIADQMLACSPEALRVLKRVVKWGIDMSAEQVEKMHFLANESRWAAEQKTDWTPSWNRG